MKPNAKNIAWIVVCSLVLAGCGSSGEEATPTPEPSLAEDFNAIIGATGVVVPEQWATLSMRGQGVVAEVLVEEGDHVVAGQPLVRLDGQAAAEAKVRSAEYELLNAQQALDELHENAPLAAAQAELALANARDALEGRRAPLDTYQQRGKPRHARRRIDGRRRRSRAGRRCSRSLPRRLQPDDPSLG